MQSSSVIQNAYIEIHSKDMSEFPLEIQGVYSQGLQPNDSFGVFTMKLAKAELTQKPIFLLFSIDKTGSMDEYANNKTKKTKLDYLIYTFQKILYYLVEKKVRIILRVHSFHSIVDVTIENMYLTSENVDLICQEISELYAEGSTDIGLALSMAEIELTKYKESYPTHQIVHLFMTDGEPTSGISNPHLLSQFINEEYMNIFFGFGNGHNAYLLRKFSEKKNTNYQFVDHIENTGLIFGDSIHHFLYPAIESAKFVIENGTLYDWRTNQWVEFLEEPLIVGEMEKIFHILTNSPDMVQVHVYGIDCSRYDPYDDETPLEISLLDIVTPLPHLIPLYYDTNPLEDSDLTRFMFRHKVQELLFHITSHMERFEMENKTKSKERFLENTKWKNEMESFFRKMRKYMRVNGLLDDPFMTLLCDDIHVTYRNIDSRHAYMYTASRQTTQGRQQSYQTRSQDPVEEKEDDHHPMKFHVPLLSRQITSHLTTSPCSSIYSQEPYEEEEEEQDDGFEILQLNTIDIKKPVVESKEEKEKEEDEYLPEDELSKYKPFKNHTTCYATPSSQDTMRGMHFDFYDF